MRKKKGDGMAATISVGRRNSKDKKKKRDSIEATLSVGRRNSKDKKNFESNSTLSSLMKFLVCDRLPNMR